MFATLSAICVHPSVAFESAKKFVGTQQADPCASFVDFGVPALEIYRARCSNDGVVRESAAAVISRRTFGFFLK